MWSFWLVGKIIRLSHDCLMTWYVQTCQRGNPRIWHPVFRECHAMKSRYEINTPLIYKTYRFIWFQYLIPIFYFSILISDLGPRFWFQFSIYEPRCRSKVLILGFDFRIWFLYLIPTFYSNILFQLFVPIIFQLWI